MEAGSKSKVGGGLVGVATGMPDILRLTGVGRAEGRRAFTEGVRGTEEIGF